MQAIIWVYQLINKKKEYIGMLRHEIIKNNLTVDEYSFEELEEFRYLGTNFNQKNNMRNKIKLIMSIGNKSYYLHNEGVVIIKTTVKTNKI